MLFDTRVEAVRAAHDVGLLVRKDGIVTTEGDASDVFRNPSERCTVGGALKSAAKKHGKRIAKKAAHGALNLVERGIRKARSKINPAPRTGYAIYARKGSGPKLHYDGLKFTNNGYAKLYWDLTSAEKMGRELIASYPILRGYKITVEERRPKH